MTPTETPTGNDLRMLRLVRRVPATAVARHYGCHRTRIAAIEAQERPTSRATRRYLAALELASAER